MISNIDNDGPRDGLFAYKLLDFCIAIRACWIGRRFTRRNVEFFMCGVEDSTANISDMFDCTDRMHRAIRTGGARVARQNTA